MQAPCSPPLASNSSHEANSQLQATTSSLVAVDDRDACQEPLISDQQHLKDLEQLHTTPIDQLVSQFNTEHLAFTEQQLQEFMCVHTRMLCQQQTAYDACLRTGGAEVR
jgi:hypothetical protein